MLPVFSRVCPEWLGIQSDIARTWFFENTISIYGRERKKPNMLKPAAFIALLLLSAQKLWQRYDPHGLSDVPG